MREVLDIILAILLIAGICSFVLAEESKGSMMGKEMMSEKAMMMKPDKMMEMCPTHKMMSKEIVATEDGGVIVMVGNKLLKYDKDLNLKKEVEIDIDIDSMQKMMKEMMEKCPMGRIMEKGMMMGEDMEESTEAEESTDVPSEHESHH